MSRVSLPVLCISVFSVIMSFSAAAMEPLEVSDRFWKAMQARDRDQVNLWIEARSRTMTPAPEALPETGAVTLKRTVIEGDEARVDTVVTPPDPSQPPASLQTLLRREAGEWKVDYAATVAQLTDGRGLAAGVRDLRVLSGDLNTRIDAVLDELQRDLPAVEKEFDDLKRELETRLPELRNRLEEFSRRIDESLNRPTTRKDLEKSI